MPEYASAITIPPDYFRKNVAHAYRCVPLALIRELFQNSLDAGATKIDFSFGPKGYVFADNGHGMTEEVLRDGFLSLGGSIKQDGSVGGFGEAKVLLCFAGESFHIHSLDNKVDGAGANFTMSKCPEDLYSGTVVKACFTEETSLALDLHPADVAANFHLFMSAADFPARVRFNGQPARTKGKRRDHLRSLDFAEVFSGPKFCPTYNVVVRHNGVPMFFTEISDLKGAVYVDLSRHGREVLTSNRDFLKAGYSGQFQSLLTEMARDTKSFARRQPRYVRFKATPATAPGEEEAVNLPSPASPVFAAGTRFERDMVKNALKRGGNAVLIEKDLTEVARSLLEQHQETCNGVQPSTIEETIVMLQDVLTEDFVIGADGGADIPKRFHPKTFSAPVKGLAKEWKVAVRTVARINKLTFPYRIGFTLMGDRYAEFHRCGSEIPAVLVNPRTVLELSEPTKSRIYRLIQLAAHELAHHTFRCHDESFTLLSEKLLLKTLQKWEGTTGFRREVRAVALFNE